MSEPRAVQVVTFEELSAAALRGVRWKRYADEHGLSGDWKRAHRYSMSRYEMHALYVKQRGAAGRMSTNSPFPGRPPEANFRWYSTTTGHRFPVMD